MGTKAYFGPGSGGSGVTMPAGEQQRLSPVYFDPNNFIPRTDNGWQFGFGMLPGESQGAYFNRLKLAAYRDAQMAGLPGVITSYTNDPNAARLTKDGVVPYADYMAQQQATSPYGGGGFAEAEAKLEEARNKAFGLLSDQRGIYDSPMANEIYGQIQGQMQGNDVPFTGDVVSRLLAENADASAGRVANEQDMIRMAMANAGLGGSGIEASAKINSMRNAGKATRSGRLQIKTTADRENFAARERARQAASSFLAQKAQAKLAPTLAEVDMLKRFEITGERPDGTTVNVGNQGQIPGGGLTPIPNQNMHAASYANGPTPGQQAAGMSGQYGGVTYLNGSGVSPFMQSTGTMRGGTMGFDLSGYSSRPNGNADNRTYSSYNSYANRQPQQPSYGGMFGGLSGAAAGGGLREVINRSSVQKGSINDTQYRQGSLANNIAAAKRLFGGSIGGTY